MEELSSPTSTMVLMFSGQKGAGRRMETERERNQKRLIESGNLMKQSHTHVVYIPENCVLVSKVFCYIHKLDSL